MNYFDVVVLLMIGVVAVPDAAADELKPSLDQQLLDSLADDLFLDLPPPASKQPGGPVEVDPELPHDQQASQVKHPLTGIAETMQRAQSRIAAKDVASETQQLQTAIVDELQNLILKMQQQSQSKSSDGGATNPSKQRTQSPGPPESPESPKSNGSEVEQAGNPNGNNAANKSTERLGKAASANVTQAERDRLLEKAWGDLPAGVRQQMQSSRPETFLPKYSRLIEDYFRRLAEEDKP